MSIIVFLFELLFVFSGDMFFHIVVAIIQKLIFLEPRPKEGRSEVCTNGLEGFNFSNVIPAEQNFYIPLNL